MAADGFRDANIILRYLLNDLPDQAALASRISDHDVELIVTDGILAEVAYVLSRTPGITRDRVVDGLIAFISKQNITILAIEKSRRFKGCSVVAPPAASPSPTLSSGRRPLGQGLGHLLLRRTFPRRRHRPTARTVIVARSGIVVGLV